MNRITKQIVYGLVYAILWFSIIYGGYYLALRPPATCTDNLLNRDEEEIDCGGVYCVSCAIKKLKPIEIAPVKLLPSVDSARSNAIVEIRNPNAAYGARSYSFDVAVFGTSTKPLYFEHVIAPVYPSELKYRLYINLPIAFSSDIYAQATSTNVVWVPLSELPKPRTPVREVRVGFDMASRRAVVTGIVQNDNAYALRRVTINGIASGASSTIAGISKTVVQDMAPKEERFFQLLIPLFNTDTDPSSVDTNLFIEAER